MENANGQNAVGRRRPSTLVFSRQGMPNMDTTSVEGVAKGAYTVHDCEGTPDAIIIGEYHSCGHGRCCARWAASAAAARSLGGCSWAAAAGCSCWHGPHPDPATQQQQQHHHHYHHSHPTQASPAHSPTPPHPLFAGTGSELEMAVKAAQKLEGEGKKVRVVSMPCWELFDEQTQAYK